MVMCVKVSDSIPLVGNEEKRTDPNASQKTATKLLYKIQLMYYIVWEKMGHIQSFQNKGFWMTKDNGCLPEGEIVYDNSSRIEPKRAHQWFPDPNEEAFPNKKQAIETSHRLFSGVPGVPTGNLSLWDNASSFQPVPGHQSHQSQQSHQSHQFTDQLFGTEPARTINFSDRSIHSIGTDNLNMGRSMEEQFRNNASVALSMSQDYLGPSIYGAGKIVKVSLVGGSDSGTAVSMGHTYQVKEPSNGIPMSLGQVYQFKETASGVPVSMGHTYQVKEPGSGLPASMGHTFNGNQGIISFSGYHEETGYHEESETGPSGRLISNYDLLMSQSSVQASEQPNEKALVVTNAEKPVGSTQALTTKTDTVPKTKADPKVSKKVAGNNNNFPSNVKSLLSTGILDGVPVKYIAWSREELRGTIKGSGYLCGCQACKFSKALNAYEFERHAGCKTKHPNNHIFFENGKTIYAIVQELRSTPQNKLFEAILTVTGSPINQKSFNLWKESYQAATRELQRIYGKDETSQPSQNVYS